MLKQVQVEAAEKPDADKRRFDFLHFIACMREGYSGLANMHALAGGDASAWNRLTPYQKDVLRMNGFVDDANRLVPDCTKIAQDCIHETSSGSGVFRKNFVNYGDVIDRFQAEGYVPKLT